MEIKETGVWNSFIVSVPRGAEDDKTYFHKTLDHLAQFYREHTTLKSPTDDPVWHLRSTDSGFKGLGGNFCDMFLKPDCDVKYKIIIESHSEREHTGIFVSCHRIENRRLQMDYLRRAWAEFSPS